MQKFLMFFIRGREDRDEIVACDEGIQYVRRFFMDIDWELELISRTRHIRILVQISPAG